MKELFLVIFIFFFVDISISQESPAIGDFVVTGIDGYNMSASLEAVSIPFEGIVNTDSVYQQVNRFNNVQNGSYWKFFTTQSEYTQYQIAYIYNSSSTGGNIFDLAHTGGAEFPPNGTINGVWGCAKYLLKISVVVGGVTKIFQCYFNSLDSRYQVDTSYCSIYGRDWIFEYNIARQRIDCKYSASICGGAVYYDSLKTGDTLSNGEPSKEFKVWELLYGIANPTKKNFYARTTPFGLSSNVYFNSRRRNYSIGTKVVLDTVFKNVGNLDRWGYNTHIGPEPPVDYFHNAPVPPGQNDTGNTYTTTAYYSQNVGEGIKLIVENGDSIILKPYKKLWVSGIPNQSPALGDTLLFKLGSTVILEHNAEIFQCFGGQIIRDSLSNIVWNNQSCIRSFENSGVTFNSGSHTVNNGAFMVIDGNATLRLGDNAILTFDGSTSYLNLKSSSQVKLGQNAKIVFKNGAYLRANGATFSQTSSGKISSGLVFENSGLDSIVNCTFNNAKTSITIKNDSVSCANSNNNIIKGNTFNISQTNGIGIYATNVLKMLVYDNDFICSNSTSQFGIYFRNNANFNGASSYSLNILYNTFENGYLPLYLSCLAADRTPFYIVRNQFYGDNLYSMDLVKISGDVKSNTFDVYNYNRSIGLWNSSPNFFSNIIESRDFNMYLNHSFPKMSAVRTEDDKIMWESGKNIFNSEAGENMVLSGSYPAIDYGKNRFQIMSSTPFHIVGVLLDTNTFRMRFNCWAGHYDSAKFDLIGYVDSTVHQICAIYIPKFCTYPIIETAPSAVITDKGNGVYDTTIVSDDNFAFLIEDDEALLIQARSDFRRHFYPEAITNYKGLIDNYNSSMYLYNALDELYDCYSELDTASDPNETDVLFGDLKEYLEEKINSEEYDITFNETAYDFLLICETRMEDYEIALTGYEFLALYHPDAEQRIIASWDYEDIEDLYGGEGGGSISNFKLQMTNKEQGSNYELQITNEEKERLEELYELREYKRLNKIIRDDPVMRKLKKGWDNESKKKKERQLKENSTDKVISSDAKVNSIQADKLISRAKENILRAKYLPKEEKEKRRMEDIVLLVGNGNTDNQTDKVTTSIPEVYELSQNYPNPFNPTTTVSYQLPKAGLVSITVYDITGKEVAKLVNEFKEAGSYDATFSASNLSSGIYFYSLKADGFTDTKKMVVIK